jgi:DNA-3-methyladenine glycosylase II
MMSVVLDSGVTEGRERSEGATAMIEVECASPYDLGLSVRAARSFASGRSNDEAPTSESAADTLRLGVRVEGRPVAIEVRQEHSDTAVVLVVSEPQVGVEALRRLVRRVVNAEMDLLPFYRSVEAHPVLGPLAAELRGLKPFRPASLFDMLVMAVTEQQISLAAAQRIQARLVERFGDEAEGLPVFPSAQTLAGVPLDALTDCGLSGRKAEYVTGAAQLVVSGALDLEALEQASNDEVREAISSVRGFGMWSADYVLIRGLGRPDVVPYDDLGIRRVAGNMLGGGGVLTPAETEAVLAPFAPFRGLATFYLLVASRNSVR